MQKKIDVQKLLDDFGIEYEVGSSGWLNLYCPLCYKNDGKKGLGYHPESGAWNCFRCGRQDGLKMLKLLLREKGVFNASKTLQKYRGYILPLIRGDRPFYDRATAVKAVFLPQGSSSLSPIHRQYLKKRGFDPEKLESEWLLMGTGPVGPFKHRIIIPIYTNRKLVNFQGRDVTGKAPEKYKSCPNEEAAIPIKSCLYGIDFCQDDYIIITEGPTKVWRLGKGTIATFGTTVTDAQILLLKKFKRRFVLFDEDEAGKEAGEKLAKTLSFSGETILANTIGIKDVGDLTDKQARTLKKELLL